MNVLFLYPEATFTFTVHLLSFLPFYLTPIGKSDKDTGKSFGKTDLPQVGSLDMEWREGNTQRPGLMITKKFPLHLLS